MNCLFLFEVTKLSSNKHNPSPDNPSYLYTLCLDCLTTTRVLMCWRIIPRGKLSSLQSICTVKFTMLITICTPFIVPFAALDLVIHRPAGGSGHMSQFWQIVVMWCPLSPVSIVVFMKVWWSNTACVSVSQHGMCNSKYATGRV